MVASQVHPSDCALGAFLVVLTCVGCGYIPEPIPLAYYARSPVTRVPGAEKVSVHVIADDFRGDKAMVCAHFNALGWLGAAHPSTPEPAAFVQRAVKAELAHRGFDLGSKGVPVVLALSSFYCERKDRVNGLLGFTDADVDFDLSVYSRGRQRAGQEIYHRHVTGVFRDRNIVGPFSIEGAQAALQAALEDAIKQLFSDQGVVNTLLSPAAQAPPPPPTGRTPPPMIYDPKSI
jgi:hypothetical protein